MRPLRSGKLYSIPGLLVLLLTAAGCGQSESAHSPAPASAPVDGEAGQTANSAAADESAGSGKGSDAAGAAEANQLPITLELADGESFQKTLESLRGKVVLVDFWAMWCIPCLKQFLHTVELSKHYADEGLAVVSVSLDDPDMSEESVRSFLQKQGADFTNLISPHGAGTRSFEEFDITGGVPHYKLYDRSGAERHRFSSTPMESDATKPIEQIEPLLKELLAEPGE